MSRPGPRIHARMLASLTVLLLLGGVLLGRLRSTPSWHSGRGVIAPRSEFSGERRLE